MTDASILYKRYNLCICSYLSSGVRGLRYRYETVNGVRIFYPYVNNEQFLIHQKRKEVIPTSSCRDKSVGDDISFDWFKKCFTIEGEANVKFDYLLYIFDCNAGYVPLRHKVVFRGGLGRHYDGKYYNDLQSSLMRDLSIGAMDFHGYSVYYRMPLIAGSFMVGVKKPAPFEIMFPLLASGFFNTHILFMNYTLKIVPDFSLNEVQRYLDTSRRRFIEGASKKWDDDIAKGILSKEWCFHTKLLFEAEANKNKRTKKQTHLIQMVLAYCEKHLKKTDLVSGRQGVPHLSFVNDNKVDVKKLYSALIREGFITNDTSEEDFVYYMTGKGRTLPTQPITWYGTNAKLVFFIYAIEGYGSCEWSVVSKIFVNAKSGEIRANSLKSSFHNTMKYSKYDKNKTYFEDLVNNL